MGGFGALVFERAAVACVRIAAHHETRSAGEPSIRLVGPTSHPSRLLSFGLFQCSMNKCRNRTAKQRRQYEHPEDAKWLDIAAECSHNCRAQTTRWVDRGSREPNADDVHQDERQADGHTGERPVAGTLGRDAKNCCYEHEREQKLSKETSGRGAVHACQAIAAQSTRHVRYLSGRENEQEGAGGYQSAHHLANDITCEIPSIEVASDEQCD